MLGLLRRRSLFLMLFLASYGIHLAMSFDPTLVAAFSLRFLTFIKLFVYFGAGVALLIFADRIPFSIAFAFGALALVMVALPFGLGAVVMPLCLPYIVIVCGLSSLPGQSLLKNDLSYGVYLIHAPILAAFSLLFPNLHIWWLAAVIVFCVTLVLSYLSCTFVEGPALRRKKGLSSWLNGRFDACCSSWSKRTRALVAKGK